MVDKNYLHTAYANSADGTDGFTTVYPNLNLIQGTSANFKNISANGWGTENSLAPNIIHYEKNKTYTCSVWIEKCDIDTRIVIYLFSPTNNPIYLGNAVKAGESGFSICTFTMLDNFDSSYISIGFMQSESEYHDITYSMLKLELGNTRTRYMPSSSEVTTADWPKYVGTYVDTNPTSSTEPSKYDWDEMKYRVYLDGVPVGGSKLLSVDLENLKAGTSYNVQVNQINGNDESDKSESVAFKTTLTK